MNRYAMYLRKSRAEEQAGLEETLARHKKQLLLLAERRGLPLFEEDIYEEVVSGESLFGRPQMLALLEEVEQGRYAAVLVMDIDRLGRGGMRDQGVILDAFKYSSTRILTPEKEYDLNNELDETATELKTFLSRQEYKAIKKRLQRGLQQTIRDGGYVANAPYGYRKTTRDKKPTLEIDETEAGFVRMIFSLYVNEGLGSVAIADTLNTLGARPHRAERFGRTSVAEILKNPVYTGKIVWDKKKHLRPGARGNGQHIILYQPRESWTVVDGLHPPIIEENLFERAQQIMRSRAHPPAKARSLRNPLAGLVRCRACTCSMQRQAQARGAPYLICTTRGCTAAAKLEDVERALLESISGRLKAILLLPPVRRQDDSKAFEKALAAAREELKKLELQRENLHDLLEQGVYDIPTYQQRMQSIEERIRAAREKESARAAELQRLSKQGESAARPVHTALEAYLAGNEKQRNLLLKSIVAEIAYDKEKKSKPTQFQLLVRLKRF